MSELLTIFTLPKPFRDGDAVRQRNAISSWTRLDPRPRVIVIGDEDGAEAACSDIGAEFLPGVERNEFNTPLLSDAFRIAEQASSAEYLCYINADIVLLSDFTVQVARVAGGSPFLLVGQRTDIDLEIKIEFGNLDWERKLRSELRSRGSLHGPTGLDYFVYTRGLWGELPPFAIGRTAWDNWLIFRARSLGANVFDASRVLTAVHQNHGYAHAVGGIYGAWKGPEAQRNLALAGGYEHAFTLKDATHLLGRKVIIPGANLRHPRRWYAARRILSGPSLTRASA